ncbi:hypothetical protein ACWIWK_06930 [Helicobacter sp. 23-1048]
MRNLLKVCVLGILAFGLSACDNDKDKAFLSITKKCESEKDKIDGCVKLKYSEDDFKVRQWYQGGKVVFELSTDENGKVLIKQRLDKVEDVNIVYGFQSHDYNLTEEDYESYCVATKEASIEGCARYNTQHTELIKAWRDEKLYDNCEYIDSSRAMSRIYINGVCGVGEEQIRQCFKDGKSYECDEKEMQKLLSQDFSDFYKRCVRKNKNGGGFEIYPAPCEN